jgi:hypothetical protein
MKLGGEIGRQTVEKQKIRDIFQSPVSRLLSMI